MEDIPETQVSLAFGLYDTLMHNQLVWPSLSVQWGEKVGGANGSKQRIYFSSRSDGRYDRASKAWEENACCLYAAEVGVPRQSSKDDGITIEGGGGETGGSSDMQTDEVDGGGCGKSNRKGGGHVNGKSTHSSKDDCALSGLEVTSVLLHRGDVNRIRVCPQDGDVIFTHSDMPEVMVWNTRTQPSRTQSRRGALSSCPDLVLVGHQDVAEYALDLCVDMPRVVSGGSDKLVIMWQWDDGSHSAVAPSAALSSSSPPSSSSKAPKVQPKQIFRGHSAAVEDTRFVPGTGGNVCISTGGDRSILQWDLRQGEKSVAKLVDGHSDDINCLGIGELMPNAVLSGGSDTAVKQWDLRKLNASAHGDCGSGGGSDGAMPVAQYVGHTGPVTTVQWSPHCRGRFVSAGEGGFVGIWDALSSDGMQKKPMSDTAKNDIDSLTQLSAGTTAGGAASALAAQESSSPLSSSFILDRRLRFRHFGHEGVPVVDFQINPLCPGLVATISDNSHGPSSSTPAGKGGGGGTLQIWKPFPFVLMDRGSCTKSIEEACLCSDVNLN